MSDELRELYQQVILDHNKKPRNFHKIENATHSAEGYNPLCGDHYTVYANVKDDKLEDISFEGAGCAISKSSASLMTESVKGKDLAEVNEMLDDFFAMVTDDNKFDKPVKISAKLKKVSLLQGVCAYPTRIKCATLAWHALRNALEKEGSATTE